jgi:hypothetical protein
VVVWPPVCGHRAGPRRYGASGQGVGCGGRRAEASSGGPAKVGPLRLNAHPFTTVDELLEVPGIGQRRFDQLKDLVTVT